MGENEESKDGFARAATSQCSRNLLELVTGAALPNVEEKRVEVGTDRLKEWIESK